MSNSELTTVDVTGPQNEPTLTPRSSAGLTTRVMRGSLWNLGGQGVTMIATLIATPFVIRQLGPERYGVLALTNVMIGYLSFADLGMGWASTRFASEAHAQGDDRREARTVWTAAFIAASSTFLVALALVFAARPVIVNFLRLPPYLQETGVLALRLAALGFLGRAFALIMNTPEIVRLRMDLLALINVGTLIGQIILVPVILYFGADLTDAVAIIAAAAIVSAVLHTLVGMHLLPEMRRPQISAELLAPLAKFGLGMMVSSLTMMVFAHADKFLITRYESVRSLAFYSVAFNLSILLSQAPLALAQSLLPAFSQLQANPNRSGLQELYHRALRVQLIWVIPAAIVLCVITRPFLTAWAGAEFGRESTPLLYLLAVGLIFEVMIYVPHTLLIALGRSDLVARYQVIALIPYLAALVVSIRWYGAMGAAIVWSLRAVAAALALAILARRISGFSFSPLPANVRGYLAALTVMTLPVLIVFLSTSSVPVRLFVSLLAVLGYSVLILTKVLSGEERTWMLRLIKRNERHVAVDQTA